MIQLILFLLIILLIQCYFFTNLFKMIRSNLYSNRPTRSHTVRVETVAEIEPAWVACLLVPDYNAQVYQWRRAGVEKMERIPWRAAFAGFPGCSINGKTIPFSTVFPYHGVRGLPFIGGYPILQDPLFPETTTVHSDIDMGRAFVVQCMDNIRKHEPEAQQLDMVNNIRETIIDPRKVLGTSYFDVFFDPPPPAPSVPIDEAFDAFIRKKSIMELYCEKLGAMTLDDMIVGDFSSYEIDGPFEDGEALAKRITDRPASEDQKYLIKMFAYARTLQRVRDQLNLILMAVKGYLSNLTPAQVDNQIMFRHLTNEAKQSNEWKALDGVPFRIGEKFKEVLLRLILTAKISVVSSIDILEEDGRQRRPQKVSRQYSHEGEYYNESIEGEWDTEIEHFSSAGKDTAAREGVIVLQHLAVEAMINKMEKCRDIIEATLRKPLPRAFVMTQNGDHISFCSMTTVSVFPTIQNKDGGPAYLPGAVPLPPVIINFMLPNITLV